MRALIVLLAIVVPCQFAVVAQDVSRRAYEGPIIDMHLHAAHAGENGPPGSKLCPGSAADMRYDPREPWPETLGRIMTQAACARPVEAASTDAENRDETIAALARHKGRGVLSGERESLRDWMQAAPKGTFIPAQYLSLSAMARHSPDAIADAFDRGEIAVLSEVTIQYDGVFADDPRFEPYWAMAEAKDLPVGIDVGVGPPGSPMVFPDFRIQNPRHLEAVLARHPKLRVYAMHAGWPYVEDLKAMLYAWPQLMVDTGVLQAALTRKEYYRFLEEIVDAGFGDRIMFGSDQMNWPGLIDEGVAAINEAPFLTYAQKKAILHDNAARFLRLSETAP
ncbi:amidohydrolase family protein [Novosphingobium aquimarinum]|uniref:amidohydrolase family protein n=1 Tax=Novosphingobium aquimarinum TaxID=2682494 RepID=UPI0012EBB25C|nr:amidohydrolase family protein [Novosphingobium aquimarinum]